MQSLCLTIARICLAAWVGAAGLFVVTSIREQTAPEFGPLTRDVLALIRFPDYYACGFSLVTLALVCGFAARNHPAVPRRRMRIVLGLLVAALLLMLADYLWVYRPLAELIFPPGESRPASFDVYHRASMYINLVDVGMCLAAAFLICWPKSPTSSTAAR